MALGSKKKSDPPVTWPSPKVIARDANVDQHLLAAAKKPSGSSNIPETLRSASPSLGPLNRARFRPRKFSSRSETSGGGNSPVSPDQDNMPIEEYQRSDSAASVKGRSKENGSGSRMNSHPVDNGHHYNHHHHDDAKEGKKDNIKFKAVNILNSLPSFKKRRSAYDSSGDGLDEDSDARGGGGGGGYSTSTLLDDVPELPGRAKGDKSPSRSRLLKELSPRPAFKHPDDRM